MKTYKILYSSTISEEVEVEASSKKEALDIFNGVKGEMDFTHAKEVAKDNLEIDGIEEISW